MMNGNDRHNVHTFCPYFHHAAELIGRRWTGAILRALLGGVKHFNEIKCAIPALTPSMLSERLKELEAEGVIVRKIIPSTPVRTEYELTDKGRDLAPVILSIEDWAHRWLAPDEIAPEEF